MLALSFITPESRRITGLFSYAKSMTLAIASCNSKKTVFFFTNMDQSLLGDLSKLSNLRIIYLPNFKFFPFKAYDVLMHFMSSIIARFYKAQSYVSLTSSSSIIPFVRQYFVIHDMYAIDKNFTGFINCIYTRWKYVYLAAISSGIICVSRATYRKALLLLKNKRKKMHIIKEASKFSQDTSKPLPYKYRSNFIYVANIESTKNVECLLNALKIAEFSGENIRVFWVGDDKKGIILDWENKNNRLTNLIKLGRIQDSELKILYAKSLALIVCSLKEGFCLPVLEAHTFGTPVVASNIPILREVAGKGGIFFEPNDPHQLLQKVIDVKTSKDYFDILSVSAIANFRKYSWLRSAKKLINLADKNV